MTQWNVDKSTLKTKEETDNIKKKLESVYKMIRYIKWRVIDPFRIERMKEEWLLGTTF